MVLHDQLIRSQSILVSAFLARIMLADERSVYLE